MSIKAEIQKWLNESRSKWISSQGLHPFTLLDMEVDILAQRVIDFVKSVADVPAEAVPSTEATAAGGNSTDSKPVPTEATPPAEVVSAAAPEVPQA